MPLGEFNDTVSAQMRGKIASTIAEIEATRGVTVLFAVESGSRAWGFPSPDSDYDVRFVYAHPRDWYLRLFYGKGVIELPIDDELDVNGWDLKKALSLLIKPNPVLLEWLSSPIRYRWNDAICSELTTFSSKASHRTACLYHYLNLAWSQWRRHIDGRETVNFKRYFYVLRPALALRWIRLHPETPPPMNFQTLVAGLDVDDKVTALIKHLLVLKSWSRETAEGARFAELDALIVNEMEWGEAQEKGKPNHHLVAEANMLFRQILARLEG